MQSKILNLPDVLKLSIILGKYITEIPKGNVSDFFDSLFDKFTPEDFSNIMYLITGEKLRPDITGNEVIKIFYEGLTKNKISTLLQTSKEIGFI